MTSFFNTSDGRQRCLLPGVLLGIEFSLPAEYVQHSTLCNRSHLVFSGQCSVQTTSVRQILNLGQLPTFNVKFVLKKISKKRDWMGAALSSQTGLLQLLQLKRDLHLSSSSQGLLISAASPFFFQRRWRGSSIITSETGYYEFFLSFPLKLFRLNSYVLFARNSV